MRRKDERVGVCDMGPAVFECGRCVARVTRLREGGKGARNPPVNVPMRAPRKKRRRAGNPEHVRAFDLLRFRPLGHAPLGCPMPALAASPEQETTTRPYADLRARLRGATADAHAALDGQLQALDLL